MSRTLFAMGAISGGASVSLLVCTSWWIQRSTHGDLDVLGPGLVWLAAIATLILASPLWWHAHEPWSRFDPPIVRWLLLLPLYFALGLLSTFVGLLAFLGFTTLWSAG